jgi:hypothetical protein
MASYTGMSNLQNHPHRSGFDIGRKNAFTAKVGELLPVYWDISMPGDKYKFSVEYFTRTQPVETSAYTRLREYFDFYAVPLRLLWKSAPSVLTQMQDINQIQALSLTQNLSLGTYLPSISLSQLGVILSRLNGGNYNPGNSSSSSRNMFGFFRGDLSYKLLNYLGYGNVVSTAPSSGSRWWSTSLKKTDDSSDYTQQYIQNTLLNVFPILTYQKIYQDFFRWSQWENANPSSYNVDYFSGVSSTLISSSDIPSTSSDYWKSDTMFDLKYCNWNKDMLMGVLPNSQFGDVAVIDLPSSVSNVQVADATGALYPVGTATVMNKGISTSPIGVDLSSGGIINAGSRLSVNVQDIASRFTVLALRQAEALQRWKEISQSGDSDYREQIRKHFGVKLPQSLSNMCTYIGGISRNLDISEVVNNNLAVEDGTAVIAGKGVGAGNGSFTYTTDEHCVVMCIYHAVPLLDYAITGQDGQLLVTDAESLPIPEFDNIGMEVLPMTQIFNSPKASIVNLFNAGYNPRYFNWKTKLDVVNGAFTTTLKSWVSPVTASLLSGWFGFGYQEGDVDKNTRVVLNYKFFKVNPAVLDPIFGVAVDSTWDTDQLLVNSYIGCYVARNLSRDGVPY